MKFSWIPRRGWWDRCEIDEAGSEQILVRRVAACVKRLDFKTDWPLAKATSADDCEISR